ncbi:hypothetical protein [Nocardia jiangxiensis]|uniref:Uncharacterized protein n=1 Tax=Nocardia jiangxiensis TaxID=282685 RepID=A0ABW6S5Y8_9NOCA|nr:hypothetical protein [Nocardia jiangxiensis]
MSEDSTQLSVAELLARNGQGAPASGGGGRRRRSGRGVSVNEFTGDMPVVREGGSSHAAPEEPAGYDAPPSPDPALAYSASPESDYSPLSGPIAYYNPLAPDTSSPSESPGYSSSGFGADSFGSGGYDSGSPDLGSGYGAADFGSPGADRSYRAPEPNGRPADPFAGSNGVQPTPGGRRARRELAESLAAQDDSSADPFGSAPMPEVPPAGGGGRRRRREPDDQMTEVQPFRGPQGVDGYAPGPDSRGMNGFAPGPDPRAPGPNSFGPGPDSRRPGGNSFGPGADSRGPGGANAFAPGPNAPAPGGNSFGPGPDPAGPSGWGPPRGPEPMGQPGRGPEGRDRGEPGLPPRMPRRNGADGPPPPPPGGLPAWSARRRAPADFPPPDRNGEPPRNGQEVPPTAMWSLANQGKPGPGPAGDPREDLDPRRGGRPLPSDPLVPRDVRPVTDLLAVDVHGRTEIYPAIGPDFDPAEEDLDLEYDEDEDDEDDLLDFDEDEDEEDDDFDERPARRTRRAPGRSSRDSSLSARSKALLQGDRPQWMSFGGGQESGRRQWLVLAGQVVGAAVAGMLLFKGFEKMWDLLPFVALALAVVVILGLVALVRVLRRTDDMYSTVIAVVVGIFVTLGPLAFLLSTN